jgi:hypothetical protein
MKKLFLLLTILIVLGVTACSQETQDQNESPNVLENEGNDSQETESDNESPKENKSPKPSKNGSTTDNDNPKEAENETDNIESKEPTNESPQSTTYENNAFKDVKVTENENGVIVTGKARVFEGVFQYAVVSGEGIVKEDHYLTAGAPAWGEFELSLGKDLLTKPGTKLELFVYSAKDGSKTDVLTVVLPEE